MATVFDVKKFYAITAKFDHNSNYNKTFVIQFSFKKQINMKCGGGYIKLLQI